MKEKIYNVKVSDTKDYISAFNGIFNLSNTEMEVLAEFVDLFRHLHKSSLNINPFSTEMKKKVAKRLGRDDFNTLNNYIKSLKEKGAISETIDGYKIHTMLIPLGEQSVKFNISWKDE